MSTDREASTLTFEPECVLPDLTPGAARVLLRILRKAHDKQLAADGDGPEMRNERDVA
jgi:hypothetical protein